MRYQIKVTTSRNTYIKKSNQLTEKVKINNIFSDCFLCCLKVTSKKHNAIKVSSWILGALSRNNSFCSNIMSFCLWSEKRCVIFLSKISCFLHFGNSSYYNAKALLIILLFLVKQFCVFFIFSKDCTSKSDLKKQRLSLIKERRAVFCGKNCITVKKIL